jgi:UDPglucose 6-dehydrogenase
MVSRNHVGGRLAFTTKLKEAMTEATCIFIAVGTPPGEDGSADLKYVLAVAREVGELITKPVLVVNKSTVPVGTASKVRKVIADTLASRGKATLEFDVASNPEFLKEGDAINDFMRPDRIVIGVDSERAAAQMSELYENFVKNGHPIVRTDIPTAELTKYAANAMLATRISFMNELSLLCDKVGADIEQVRKGIGTDSRIGMPFLYAGLGYGGSCFPKDVQALQRTMEEYGLEGRILKAVEDVNKAQRRHFAEQVKRRFGGSLKGKTIAAWGLTFKPKTDDMREAPSVDILLELMAEGATVHAYDPEGIENAKPLFGKSQPIYFEDKYSPLKGADALLLLTEWFEFRNPDFDEMKKRLRTPLVFDGRNQYDSRKMASLGIEYYCVGRHQAVK